MTVEMLEPSKKIQREEREALALSQLPHPATRLVGEPSLTIGSSFRRELNYYGFKYSVYISSPRHFKAIHDTDEDWLGYLATIFSGPCRATKAGAFDVPACATNAAV